MADDRLQRDAMKVAKFIVGWWPGLEGGIQWGNRGHETGETHPAYQAAERILERADDA